MAPIEVKTIPSFLGYFLEPNRRTAEAMEFAEVMAFLRISCAIKLQGNALADGVFSSGPVNSMKIKGLWSKKGGALWWKNCRLKPVSLL